MKIALISDSLLLGKTLEMYLKDYLTSYKVCDFVVATQPIDSQKPVFLIGEYENANLNKPFTKEVLLEKLRIFYESIKNGKKIKEEYKGESEEEIKQTNVESVNWNEVLSDIEFYKQEKKDDVLHEKIRDVLERYAREIEGIILEHWKDKDANRQF